MQIASSNKSLIVLAIGFAVLLLSLLIFLFEDLGVAIPFVIPILGGFTFYIFGHPRRALDMTLISSFLAIGIIRYIGDVPLGLTVDFFLIMALVVAVFHRSLKPDYRKLNTGLMWCAAIWMLYCTAELFNPEAVSRTAWVYAIRGLALYMFLTIPITLLYANKVEDLNRFIKIVIFLSFLAALWGLKQFYFGPDFAETAWLKEGKNQSTHVLFGQLRVFSFFSDAGQFGSGIAQAGVIAAVIALGPFSPRTRILSVICALLFFFLMILSGTRGALIVPVVGMLVYLFASRNFKLLAVGLMVMVAAYGFLQYTTIANDIYQVRRMRTALDPNDASLQVRLANRVIIRDYLKDKPFGGGIGTSGSWGERFSPGTLLAETPNDGWYVRVRAETGVIGLYLHVGTLVYIGLVGLYKCMKIKDEKLRHKLLALLAGYAGIAASSYGNPLLGQIPTGIILYMSWAYLFMAEDLDKQLGKEEPNR
jgi:hypothetical protein